MKINLLKKIRKQIAHVHSNHYELISEAEFNTILNKNWPKGVCIETVSINDITKALEIKPAVNRQEIEQNLPPDIRHHIDIFMDDNPQNTSILPPSSSRGGYKN